MDRNRTGGIRHTQLRFHHGHRTLHWDCGRPAHKCFRRAQRYSNSLHRAEGKAAVGGGRADVPACSDAADAVGQHVMPGDVSPGGDGDVARLRAERARAAIELGVIVVVLEREVAGDIATGGDGDIASGISAYAAQAGRDLVIRRSSLPKNVTPVVAASIHITKLRRHADAPASEGPYAVVAHGPRAERISGTGIYDHLVGHPEIDIAVERLDR